MTGRFSVGSLRFRITNNGLSCVFGVSGIRRNQKQQKPNNILCPAVPPDYLNRNKAHEFQTRSLISHSQAQHWSAVVHSSSMMRVGLMN